MNAVLERLYTERTHQVEFVDELLAHVDADGRDLVEAEQANLASARERIGALDLQIEPLEAFEASRDTHRAAQRGITPPGWRGNGEATPVGGAQARTEYASPGHFLVDYLQARGHMTDGRGSRLPANPDALARVQYALTNQTTTDTPGLLPDPIVGTVVNLIDATRPLITSLGGGRSMGGIPGKTFGRPRITQHVTVGPQSAEKAELPTGKMVIGEVSFTKGTFGGAVDVSRQDIDWTSPGAWDILIRDLADVYAIETEEAVAAAFAAAADNVNAATPVGSSDLEGIAAAMYTAAGLVYAASKRLPDTLWVATDVWAALGPIVDLQLASMKSAGSGSPATFAGNLFALPRIVVPTFPAGTAVIGAANAYEVYEEAIGLLTAVEPSLLGVEVAYGGYIAHNVVIPEALAPITGMPALPLGTTRTGTRKSDESKG